jgi:hypothetical protein
MGMWMFNAVAEEVVFNDIPANHWAKKYVYKIVELGVTKGFPDGTFRGNQTLTRYETTVFLAKLAEALEAKIDAMSGTSKPAKGSDNAATNRLLQELKAELEALDAEVSVLKSAGAPGTSDGFNIDGKITARGRVLNLAGSGTRSKTAMERAEIVIQKMLPNGTLVRLGYDTDYMLYDGAQNLPTTQAFSLLTAFKAKLFDVPLGIEISSGPGLGVDGIGDPKLAPEDKLKVSTKVWGMDVVGEYIQRSAQTTLLKGEIATVFPLDILGPTDIKMGAMDYFTGLNPLNNRDLQLYGEISSMPSEKIKIGASLLLGKSFETDHIGVGGSFVLDDLWATNTVIQGSAYKFGAKLFEPITTGSFGEYAALKINASGYWVGMNPFSSTGFIGTDLAASVTQKLNNTTSLIAKLWMPFTGTLSEVIFTRANVKLATAVAQGTTLFAAYDYTSYGKGAVSTLRNTSADYIEGGASIAF